MVSLPPSFLPSFPNSAGDLRCLLCAEHRDLIGEHDPTGSPTWHLPFQGLNVPGRVPSGESGREASAHVPDKETRVQKVQTTCPKCQRVEPGQGWSLSRGGSTVAAWRSGPLGDGVLTRLALSPGPSGYPRSLGHVALAGRRGGASGAGQSPQTERRVASAPQGAGGLGRPEGASPGQQCLRLGSPYLSPPQAQQRPVCMAFAPKHKVWAGNHPLQGLAPILSAHLKLQKWTIVQVVVDAQRCLCF